MTMDEARDLVSGPIWPKVRDAYLATGAFEVYPKGDIRRLAYLDDGVRAEIAAWQDGLSRASAWRTVVDGAKVRELKAAYPGVYPDAIRYLPYFERLLKGVAVGAFPEEATRLLLKLKFPEAYQLCFC